MKYSDMVTQLTKAINKNTEEQIDLTHLSQMASYIELWDLMYKNKAPWLNKNIHSCNLPASIAGEIARLVTLEMSSEVTGSSRANYLNGYYKNFLVNLRRYVEYGCAKGGIVFKPYVTENGLAVQCVQADGFFPISFDDSGNIADCLFTEQFRRSKKIYTRVERHELSGKNLIISNRVFVSSNDATLGSEISINMIDKWSMLAPEMTFVGTNKLPIGFFKIPLANTIDSDSPIGVSVYSRATDTFRKADERYSQIDWEYSAKEAAVHVASSMLKYNKDLDKYEYPGGKDRLYRNVEYNTGPVDKPFIDTYSPDIRDQSLFNGFNNQLRLVEFNSNLAYGTLSDPNNVDKTAEEIKASKQRSYAMVLDTQLALQSALEDLIDAMNFWASIYSLAPEGTISTGFEWDDSIVVDTEKERQTDRADVAMGALNLWEYRARWYGETEEIAKAMTAKNNIEGDVTE